MIVYEQGGLVKSLSGHDKNEIFVILREDGEYLYLADGKTRTADKPKRKNKKHVQIIHVKKEELNQKLVQGFPVTDVEIKTFIRHFKREN